jgi:hypothetical protein
MKVAEIGIAFGWAPGMWTTRLVIKLDRLKTGSKDPVLWDEDDEPDEAEGGPHA